MYLIFSPCYVISSVGLSQWLLGFFYYLCSCLLFFCTCLLWLPKQTNTPKKKKKVYFYQASTVFFLPWDNFILLLSPREGHRGCFSFYIHEAEVHIHGAFLMSCCLLHMPGCPYYSTEYLEIK